jgi:two-component system, sensor histidine kinase and response regulator
MNAYFNKPNKEITLKHLTHEKKIRSIHGMCFLMISLFVIELLIMIFLDPYFSQLSPLTSALLDAFLLTVLLIPGFYFFYYRKITKELLFSQLAHKELKETAAFNDALLNTIPFCLDIVDKEGNILFVNNTFKQLVDRNPTGLKCWDVYRDEHTQCPNCPLTTCIETGETLVSESNECLGGKTFRIHHTGMEYNGQKAVLEVLQDITHEKIHEEQMNKISNLKDEYVNMVSHEIRNPLMVIQQSMQLLNTKDNECFNEQQKKLFRIFDRSINRLFKMITDILDVSKIESGTLSLTKEEFSINQLINKVIEEYKIKAHNKAITLLSEAREDNIMICADRDKIEAVLINLASNAIKFTEKGSITFKLDRTSEGIKCSVTDTGQGMTEENLKSLFNKYQQFGKNKNPKEKGTGLGLSISKGYIEMHEGQLWAQSTINSGSTLSFILPN